MAFGTATVLTNTGKGLTVSQLNGTTATPPKFIAIGTGAQSPGARTANAADAALTTEYTAVARATGTVTTISSGSAGAFLDVFQTTGTILAAGAINVDEAGLFTSVTSSAAGMAVSATFPVIGLLTGDSIQITGKIQYT